MKNGTGKVIWQNEDETLKILIGGGEDPEKDLCVLYHEKHNKKSDYIFTFLEGFRAAYNLKKNEV